MCGFMASQGRGTGPDERNRGRVAVGVDEIIAAATALTWAARYDVARRLLDSAVCSVGGGAAARHLALTAAATAVHHDFRTVGARWAPEAIAAAEAVTDTEDRWRLDILELQHDYGRELIGPDGSPAFGCEGRDPARSAALARRAETLVASASDVADAGWAAFYRGLIDDNLTGDPGGAQRWLIQALGAAEQAGDDYLAGEALRHLGDHDAEAGELARARARWERSAELWARIGNMTGVLAQQLMLAQLAIKEGRPAAGTAIAQEVSRWAGALGLVLYQKHADALLGGEHDAA
jgi:tetratricopeptide (TPR) repeat protein